MTDDIELHDDDVIEDDSDETFPPLPDNDPVPPEVVDIDGDIAGAVEEERH